MFLIESVEQQMVMIIMNMVHERKKRFFFQILDRRQWIRETNSYGREMNHVTGYALVNSFDGGEFHRTGGESHIGDSLMMDGIFGLSPEKSKFGGV